MSTISCLVENLIPTVSFGSSSVYNLLPDPLGFLPVPFLGSFFFFLPSVIPYVIQGSWPQPQFFLPSVILSLIKLNISSTSSSFNSLGSNGFNLLISVLAAFLAAVPDAPPCVTIVATLKLG